MKLHTLGFTCFFFMECHRYIIGRAKNEALEGLVLESVAGVLSTWLLPILVSILLQVGLSKI